MVRGYYAGGYGQPVFRVRVPEGGIEFEQMVAAFGSVAGEQHYHINADPDGDGEISLWDSRCWWSILAWWATTSSPQPLPLLGRGRR